MLAHFLPPYVPARLGDQQSETTVCTIRLGRDIGGVLRRRIDERTGGSTVPAGRKHNTPHDHILFVLLLFSVISDAGRETCRRSKKPVVDQHRSRAATAKRSRTRAIR